jgi:DNA topoisomerase-2
VNCLIENPAFDSQTKETLTTRTSHFGSKCHLSKAFLDKVLESTNLVEYILNWAKLKQQSELTTKSGKQQRRIIVPKLYDANLAGNFFINGKNAFTIFFRGT